VFLHWPFYLCFYYKILIQQAFSLITIEIKPLVLQLGILLHSFIIHIQIVLIKANLMGYIRGALLSILLFFSSFCTFVTPALITASFRFCNSLISSISCDTVSSACSIRVSLFISKNAIRVFGDYSHA
jgi:hypothetical protein